MKNKSIRFKLTLWFSAVLILVVGITLLSTVGAGRTVLQGTIRKYLISTVEENVDNIRYVQEKGNSPAVSYISLENGYLEIDSDFMDVVYDVYTALYLSDGTLLYGENPLSKEMAELSFSGTRTWHISSGGIRYDLYDRKLNIELPDDRILFIRGTVPETGSVAQLNQITRLTLILLPVLILIAVIPAYIMADRLLSPLRKIEKTASEISRGEDLKERIEVENLGDEVGHLAQSFNHMLDRLEHAFETERQFTSDVSHELRTPTTVILAEAEYALEKDRTNEDYKESLQVIKKQGDRMNTLITDMLDYTRMDQGAERYPFEEVDLSETAAEISGQMALLKMKDIRLEAQIEPGIRIQGNKLLLSRLLQNLISNAYRYGKEKGHIWVSLEKKKDMISLSVRDDGTGISKEDKEKIFDRFYRSDASRSIQGTGLGLSIVKKIADLHQADVEVESVPDIGSTFRISFPVK